MATCGSDCRLALASAVCSALSPGVLGPAPMAELLHADVSRPLLQTRAATLLREFGCANEPGSSQTVARPLQSKGVENGKSGSAFLVAGGDGVDPEASSTFSVILKQVNSQEAAILPSLLPQLVPHFARQGGSLLTPLLGWLRYTPADGGPPFDTMLMANAARKPPGGRGLAGWKPFDVKGIRLYSHERRFEDSFGAEGLRVGAACFAALRQALHADVRLLTDHQLVDYSYLISVFPTGAPPRPCERASRDADYHTAAGHARTGLVAASYRLPGREAWCAPVLLRLSIIDYLREYRLVERMEHLQKSITRDLRAGERNHAVLPTREFSARMRLDAL